MYNPATLRCKQKQDQTLQASFLERRVVESVVVMAKLAVPPAVRIMRGWCWKRVQVWTRISVPPLASTKLNLEAKIDLMPTHPYA